MDTQLDTAHDLVLTRRLPAPPEAVFAAWTEAAQLQDWWGPRGMTVPVARVELRPGGVHEAPMRDTEGREYPCRFTILEVAAPHRMVMRTEGEPFPGATLTLGFEPDPAGTRLDILWRHPTAEMRDQHRVMGFARGWGEMLDKLTAHVATTRDVCPMSLPRSVEHGWLHRLLGEWAYENSCTAPDGQEMTAAGRESFRSLGGYWVVGEAEGTMPGGGPARWMLTLGHDGTRFRGSWAGSMMGHLFVYAGTLSEDGSTLSLDSEGPGFDGTGMARYRDEIEMVDDDTRLFRSLVQGPDGAWTLFMSGTSRRLPMAAAR
ncbi:DUF1579 family protein [Sediminicoccus sp. KRV36]|uniref:DUF1579 family protein n=1 Tax=Sediminicoccus sp. KRV36 TaxID=3133721 RepID=UPI00200BAD52|nr:DUF1579 family protein [Sediminicoccus rosea]UPY36570.1 DUF1579 family protein [Sediminicoccus rosea]